MNPYQDHTDTDLVIMLANSNQTAFETIYRRYASELYRFARSRILSGEDCREMVQDVFESLWVRRQSLSIDSLRSYLFSSVRYMIIRHLYQRGVKQRYLDHYNTFSELFDTISTEEDPDELQKTLVKALEGLPDRCRDAMTMRLRENLSNGEIAERMQVTKKTVENYMSQAILHLRSTLKEVLRRKVIA
jgi:RNA polymerase sigma-70 factor (family 1)